jgi:membrane-associated HD superfamily phosphohydrolase
MRLGRIVLIALVVATAGCHNSGGLGDRRTGVATAAAERKASEAARGLEVEHGSVRARDRVLDDLLDAAEEVRREREDVAEAAARERVQYKKMLSKEILSIDKRVGELQQELARATGNAKDTKERDISAARGWRARLKHDLEDLERIDEEAWPEVKDRIDHDLEDERPAAVPKSLEKSYAI